jgi:hypothetical protein
MSLTEFYRKLNNKYAIFFGAIFVNIFLYDLNGYEYENIFAESATNYVANLKFPFFQYLLIKDFGYYSIPSRIIAYSINVFKIDYAFIPKYLFVVSRLFLYGSLFYILKQKFHLIFSHTLKNIEIYFSILILFSFNYEMKYLHNIGYIGILITTIVLIKAFSIPSEVKKIDCFVILFFALTKPQVIYLLPFALFLFFYNYRNFSNLIKLTIFLFIIMLLGQTESILTSSIGHNRFDFLLTFYESSAVSLIHCYNFILLGLPLILLKLRINIISSFYPLFSIIGIIYISILLQKIYYKGNLKILILLLFSLSIIFLNVFNNIIQLPEAYSLSHLEFGRPFQRHEFMILIASFLIFNITLSLFEFNYKYVHLKIYLIVLFLSWPVFTYLYYLKNETKPNFIGLSNWNKNASNTKKFSALLDPLGWFYNYKMLKTNYSTSDNLNNFFSVSCKDSVPFNSYGVPITILLFTNSKIDSNNISFNNFKGIFEIKSEINKRNFFTNLITIYPDSTKNFNHSISLINTKAIVKDDKIRPIFFILQDYSK